MRNDISIELMAAKSTYEPLDLSPDENITLNFISNILSSIEDITCSVSQTIKVPHTVRNDRLLDLAKVPSHDSQVAYKKTQCRVYINGIDMIGPAWCYVTDSDEDSYSVVITFGLMQNLGSWIDNKPGLRDLEPRATDQNGDFYGTTLDGAIWQSGAGSGYWAGSRGYSRYDPAHRWSTYFGDYDCGVSDKTKCNIHPWVSLREIYERIIRENNLSFKFPSGVLADMENLGLVLTPMSKGSRAASSPALILNLGNKYDNSYEMALTQPGNYSYFSYGNFLHIGDGDTTIHLPSTDIYIWGADSNFNGTNRYTYQDFIDNINTNKSYLKFYNGSNLIYIYPTKVNIGGRNRLKFTLPTNLPTYAYENPGTPVVSGSILGTFVFTLRSNDDSDFYYYNQEPNNGFYVGIYENSSFIAGLTTVVEYKLQDVSYPEYGYYDLVANLPDITQVDFIQAICWLFGLFPYIEDMSASVISFVPYENVFEAIAKAVDWSDKLVDTGLPSPNRIAYTLEGYDAQRNWMRYQEDENEATPNNDASYIPVQGDWLDLDKTIVEFPWAASSGNKITQYRINEDNNSVEFVDCKFRLMAIYGILNDTVQDFLASKTLSFPASLTAVSILSQRYSELMKSVRTPKVITEHIRLNERDLKNLDFIKPVYMKKYGRYFAVKSIQWSSDSDTSKVELLTLNQ